MIIGINGYLNSGKDTVATIIQYLIWKERFTNPEIVKAVEKQGPFGSHRYEDSGWEVKKWAGKLKEVASILTGIPAERFEDRKFKESLMPDQWSMIVLFNGKGNGFGSKAQIFADQDDLYAYYDDFDGDPELYRRRITYREFMQWLGTEAVRNSLHPNAWVNALMAEYTSTERKEKRTRFVQAAFPGMDPKSLPSVEFPNWIISDTRFANEAAAIKKTGGFVIRVNRPEPEPEIPEGFTGKIERHSSEIALDHYTFDYVINNDSTLEDLTMKVKIMLEDLGILSVEMRKI